MSSRTGEGLVVSAVAHGEKDVRVRVLCPERGLLAGLVKGGRSKAHVLQPFNGVGYEHYRRLEGQLGTLTLDLRLSRGHRAMGVGGQGAGYLAGYLSELLGAVLPEEHKYEGLVERVERLLDKPCGWQEVVGFELFLLDLVGYGLRLDDVVEGEGELAFVSPTSGRSVTRGAARGWEDRLLTLPFAMGGPECGEHEDFMNAWRLTGCFLGKALHGKELAARARLAENLMKGMVTHEQGAQLAA